VHLQKKFGVLLQFEAPIWLVVHQQQYPNDVELVDLLVFLDANINNGRAG
jgi:hypothetical protein